MNKSLYIALPNSLYEDLRKYCFDNDVSKRDVVIAALSDYFRVKKPRPAPVTPQKPTSTKDIIDELRAKANAQIAARKAENERQG